MGRLLSLFTAIIGFNTRKLWPTLGKSHHLTLSAQVCFRITVTLYVKNIFLSLLLSQDRLFIPFSSSPFSTFYPSIPALCTLKPSGGQRLTDEHILHACFFHFLITHNFSFRERHTNIFHWAFWMILNALSLPRPGSLAFILLLFSFVFKWLPSSYFQDLGFLETSYEGLSAAELSWHT